MRQSKAFIPTLKEVPAEAEVVSHVYLVRGGYIRKVAAGIYSLLPLGSRVVRKIADIVRAELNRAGAMEVLMPTVLPAELWMESGRWQVYGPELLRLQDRKGGSFCLGPTHEEAIVEMVRRDVRSYRELPLNLYQIQGKFRDELRPRAGLMRGREFLMKDAYSFHADEADARREYLNMYETYERIFRRCGLQFRAVEAATGAIGGSTSHEFQVLADSGEDAIVACDHCDYAANIEKAEVRRQGAAGGEHLGQAAAASAVAPARETVDTPGKRTVEEVTAFLGLPASRLVKTLIYLADGKPLAALVRGDHELNEVKLKAVSGASELCMAAEAAVVEVTRAKVGFAGPVGLDAAIPIFADLDLRATRDLVTGANQDDRHHLHVHLGRDFAVTRFADLRMAAPGDPCPRCSAGVLRGHRGIEVGQVFFLGTKYSAPMGCTFLDEKGEERPMVMGCYGIGVTRIAAAAIEQNHDADGIVWPMPIAPFQVHLLSLQQDAQVVEVAERLHGELEQAGVEVLYDDRDQRPGVKFKDADLLGMPLRIAVGKKGLAQGGVELRPRKSRAVEIVAVDGVVARVTDEVARGMAVAQ